MMNLHIDKSRGIFVSFSLLQQVEIQRLSFMVSDFDLLQCSCLFVNDCKVLRIQYKLFYKRDEQLELVEAATSDRDAQGSQSEAINFYRDG